ncbi:MAG TPA: hypothetical protein VGD89_03530 [Flavipsychrobacter sp.]
MTQHNDKDMKNIIDALETEQPSMRFSKNVMEAIDGLEVAKVSKRYVNPWVIRMVAAILILCVITSVVYVYIASASLPDYSANLAQSNFQFQKFSNYILGANILLLLVFIERWFSKKNRSKLYKDA